MPDLDAIEESLYELYLESGSPISFREWCERNFD
jgi:hypothetical protein